MIAFVTNLMIALRFSISALLILFCSIVISPLSFDKKCNKRGAQITFQRKNYNLGRYDDKEECLLQAEDRASIQTTFSN